MSSKVTLDLAPMPPKIKYSSLEEKLGDFS